MVTKQEFATRISVLCEAYGQKSTPATFMAYEIGIGLDVDAKVFDIALERAILRDSPFMPKPGEMKRAMDRIQGRLRKQANGVWLRVVGGKGIEPLAAMVAAELPYSPVDGEVYYTKGRQQFIERYMAIIKNHGGSLKLAVESLKLLPAPEAKQ